MRRSFILVLIIFLQFSCGTKLRDEKEKINGITVSLSHPAGSYSYKPWVQLTRKGEEFTAVEFYVKVPGDTDFKLAESCSGSLYGSTESINSSQRACVKIEKSGTLSYYLKNSVAQSDTKSVEYAISSISHDITVESRTLPSNTPEIFVLKEVETFCSYSQESGSLNLVIQASNTEKLSDLRYAYVILGLSRAEAGSTTHVTHENDGALGVDIKPISDAVPWNGAQATYMTSVTLKDASGARISSPSCVMTVTEAQPAGLINGTFTCTELTGSSDLEYRRLGPMISLSGNWQCDSFNL